MLPDYLDSSSDVSAVAYALIYCEIYDMKMSVERT